MPKPLSKPASPGRPWPGRAARCPSLGWVVLASALSAGLPGPARADGLLEFRGADLKLGEQLLRQHQCKDCHVRRVGGDGSAIYQPTGRVNRPAALLAMVERCNTELGLQMFPEDVAAVAAVLQRDHYRFK